jgi:hypothetical protein
VTLFRVIATVTLYLVLAQVQGTDQQSPAFPHFADVASEAGLTARQWPDDPNKDYILQVNGNGAAFFDYDNDGDLDLGIASGSTPDRLGVGGDLMVALYENDQGRFADITAQAGLDRLGWGMGICVADYNGDGNSDLYLTAYGRNLLYRNSGDGTFADVTDRAGIGDPGWSTNCAFADYDRDGDVDLYVANYLRFDDSVVGRGESRDCRFMGIDVFCGPRGLAGTPDTLYRNNGDGTFSDVTAEAGIDDPGYYGFSVVFTDLDQDLWPDIYVANDSVPNLLFHNNGDGTFSEAGLISGTSLNNAGQPQAGMGLAVGDYDGDGDFDLFVTNFIQDTNTLYESIGDLLFYDATHAVGLGEQSLAYLGWGTGFQDLDNDGWPDLLVVNGHVYPGVEIMDVGQSYRQPAEVYRNLDGERFVPLPPDAIGDLAVPHSARGVAFGDYDNDGDIDALAVNMDEPPSLYRNDGGNANAWITFRLEGAAPNTDAIGARVEIEADGRTRVDQVRSGGSYLSHNAFRVHFGLGQSDRIDAARVIWPDGTVDELGPLDARQFLTVRQGDGVVGTRTPSR